MSSAETKEDLQKYLDPKVLSRIARLDIKARLIVDKLLADTPSDESALVRDKRLPDMLDKGNTENRR